VNTVRFPFLILLAAFIAIAGCSTKTPDPLTAWHFSFDQDPAKINKAIQDDYQTYIQKLPPEEKNYVGGTSLFEDGTGQIAVRIETNERNECWYHVLIYDKKGKRIKVIKYYNGKYMS
jgi:hypothetical protein